MTSGGRKLILLVEDSREAREIFAMCLEGAGYVVLQSANGREALAVTESVIPHAVITDMRMPHMNGLDMARAMKDNVSLSHVQIGLISATPPHRSADLSCFSRVLTKPCTFDELLELADFLTADLHRASRRA